MWLAVVPSFTCFTNYLIEAGRARRSARGWRRRLTAAARRHLAGVRRRCRGGAGTGPASRESMEHRQRAATRAPGAGLCFPHVAGGNTLPLQAGPEPESGRVSEVFGRKNIFGSSCSSRLRHQNRCWWLGAQQELALFFCWATTGYKPCSPDCGGFLLELTTSTIPQ